MKIKVVFEDAHFIAVNKPNNMLVYPSYFARNIKDKTLIDYLTEMREMKLYPIHRLDYKTSGVLLFGKSPEMVRRMQVLFQNGDIEKTYLALARGHTRISGKIDTPVKNPETGKYKDALTHFYTLSQVEIPISVLPFETSRYSLLRLVPKTGRMHQLRKHLNKISHPIIGDHKYGDRHHNRMFAEQLDFPNMFLHAEELSFKHPATGEYLSLTAELPHFWDVAMDKLTELIAQRSLQ